MSLYRKRVAEKFDFKDTMENLLYELAELFVNYELADRIFTLSLSSTDSVHTTTAYCSSIVDMITTITNFINHFNASSITIGFSTFGEYKYFFFMVKPL